MLGDCADEELWHVLQDKSARIVALQDRRKEVRDLLPDARFVFHELV